VVTHVSADATDQNPPKTEDAKSSEKLQTPSTYKAIVTLDKQDLTADGESLKLAPGMQVVAEINQGTRTVLEYLLSPVQKAFHEAARER
jgi:HlyD family secretion protein